MSSFLPALKVVKCFLLLPACVLICAGLLTNAARGQVPLVTNETATEVEKTAPPENSELSNVCNSASIPLGCDCINQWWSMVIGACAGALVVAGARLLDRFDIDDAVGTRPVHGLCRTWRCLASGFIPDAPLA